MWHIYAMEFQVVIKGKWCHDICKKKEATRNLYIKQNEADTHVFSCAELRFKMCVCVYGMHLYMYIYRF